MSETAALIVGLILGSLLSGGVTFTLDLLRERRAARAAARAVQAELTEYSVGADAAASEGKKYPLPLEAPVWRMHAAGLAGVMTLDDFAEVASFYAALGVSVSANWQEISPEVVRADALATKDVLSKYGADPWNRRASRRVRSGVRKLLGRESRS